MDTVVASRGGHPETEHRVSVAVCGPDGRLLASVGDPLRAIPARSTAKPFQAQALFRSGAHARFAMTAREVALACASHQAAPMHVDAVAALLVRLGLDASALECGAHPPLDPPTLRAHHRAGAEARPLHNNCSGKHAGMLASALALGAPTRGYLDPDHPVQQLIERVHIDLGCGDGAAPPPRAMDGCSAPTWVVPLRQLARMYALLADPAAAPEPDREGLASCFSAMTSHPELVAGEGVLDTTLMRALPGVVAAKRGAAGCYGLALRATGDGPVGVALKIEDGDATARSVAVVRVLDELGVSAPALDELRRPARRNRRDRVVGHVEARFRLRR